MITNIPQIVKWEYTSSLLLLEAYTAFKSNQSFLIQKVQR